MTNYFASNVKFLRLEHNWTQSELAKMVGGKTSHTTIGRWEKGIIEPTLYYIIKLADIFKVSIADLVGRDLQIINSTQQGDIEYTLLKKALIEKGYMKENEDLTEENLKKVMEIYNLMKNK